MAKLTGSQIVAQTLKNYGVEYVAGIPGNGIWTLTDAFLEEESKIGRSPTTSGKGSGIVGIYPPVQFPPAVWEELVKQGKLKRSSHGMYELVEEDR